MTERTWIDAAARGAIAAIVAEAEAAERDGLWPGHELDEVDQYGPLCSLYLGSAGMIWGLGKLGSSLDCAAAVTTAIEHYRATPDFGGDAHPPSLWMGESGLLVVADKVGAAVADRERLRQLASDIQSEGVCVGLSARTGSTPRGS